MKRMKLKRFLVSVILIIVTFTSFTCFGNGEGESTLVDKVENINIDTQNNAAYASSLLDSSKYIAVKQKNDIFNKLVDEVDNYIYAHAPSAHTSISKHIVTKCLDNNIDICFAMSQTQIETNFGTAGAGRPTSRRSMFGVSKKTYSNYESAIDDYISILKKSYLVKGRTEHDLMKNYVTVGGYRYASSTKYEANLSKTYKEIKRTTDIYTLQKHYLTM